VVNKDIDSVTAETEDGWGNCGPSTKNRAHRSYQPLLTAVQNHVSQNFHYFSSNSHFKPLQAVGFYCTKCKI